MLSRVGRAAFKLCLSVPLALEYEAAAKRDVAASGLTPADVDDVIDYLCRVSEHREVHYLWRPYLQDPGDDMVLELAVESGCKQIVTHNIRDFAGAERFGVAAMRPGAFLRAIGEWA